MDYRKCPKCGHQMGVLTFFKKLIYRPSHYQWECSECKTKLRFDVKRRLLFAVIGAGSVLLYLTFMHQKQELINPLVVVIGYIVLIATLYTFNKFVKVKEPGEE